MREGRRRIAPFIALACAVLSDAQIDQLSSAIQQLDTLDLRGCSLYTTVEPCVLCGYAIRRTDVRVYGRKAPGTSRLLIDKERRLVVGATFTGAEVQDMLARAHPLVEARDVRLHELAPGHTRFRWSRHVR